MLETSISQGFTAFKTELNLARHRSAIFLSGSFSWAVEWFFKHHLNSPCYSQAQGQTVKLNDHCAIFCESSAFLTNKSLEQAITEQWCKFSKIESDHVEPIHFITGKTYRHHLGRENSAIFFADPMFNVDAFAALSGTLVAGGMLYVWLGDKEATQNQASAANFINRLKSYAQMQQGVYWLDESQAEDLIFEPYIENDGREEEEETKTEKIAAPKARVNPQPALEKIATADQLKVIERIEKVLNGRRGNPLVLTADRGRGKSTALALATVHLFLSSQRALNIVVTAPHKMALGVFFSHVRKLLAAYSTNDCHVSNHYVTKQNVTRNHASENQICWQQHCLTFMPVDELLRTQHHLKHSTDLLLVDEAAGIPVYLLNKLVELHSRVVFSSTIHGYEGAGKGFTGKFIPLLSAKGLSVNKVTLKEPIRWAAHDPLEQLIFDTCLLNASLSELPESFKNSELPASFGSSELTPDYRYFNGETLARDESLLIQVFAILVTAHYQTKPSDLKLFLDDASISVAVQMVQQQVVSVALLIEEQIADKTLHSAIVSGQRRLKGQLIPQSLAQQSQLKQALAFRYLRVMRIAVHPQAQSLGLGSALLSDIQAYAKQTQVDFLATSFAASEKVVSFWHQNGYTPVKLGFNRDASSGEHSLVMLYNLGGQTEQSEFLAQLTSEFYEALTLWLADEFNDLDYSLVMKLLAITPEACLPHVSARDEEKLLAFKNNTNLYRLARPSLARWLAVYIARIDSRLLNVDAKNADAKGQAEKTKLINALKPMVAKCMMLHQDAEMCQRFGFTGRKALYQHFQQLIKFD